jgi:phenylalanyl-tRNA synthetase beta chain
MRVPLSWMREFVDVPDDAQAVASRLAGCGFELAGIEGDVIDFEITANRPDCLSVYGLAREASVAFDLPLRDLPVDAAPAPAGPAPIKVSIGDPGCGRYALAVVDVTIGPSPAWLADRLTAAGVRPINNVVDVTNYVMVEMGHPTHAFDAARLAGGEIRVRRARAGERLTTLDGQTRTLDETMLVIADRDRAVAVAGVMGGLASEVSEATTRIALESAWFQPTSVRAASRRLGLKTEASARFERGADITAPARALARACTLFERVGAGRATARTDVYPRPAEPREVALDRARLARLLGDRVPDADVERILSRLGFTVTATTDGWRATVPAFRVDVTREADLIEEVGRHWGFDRIPATFPALRAAPPRSSAGVERDRALRRLLGGAGLQEAATFTFIEQIAAAPFAPAGAEPVAIANPLSEKFAVLRPSLLPGLLDAVAYNRRRETPDVRLFEIGRIFAPDGERTQVAWVLAGAAHTHWSGAGWPADFFDAKGIAELIGAACGVTVDARPAADLPGLLPGRAATLSLSGVEPAGPIGAVGQIRPAIVAARGLGVADVVYAGVLDPDGLPGAGAALTALGRAVTPLPRHPSVVRDLSIFVSERLPAARVRGTIRAHAPATLVSALEFDRYQGKGVPPDQVSLSWRLTFRAADRTLTDVEVQRAVDAIVAALVREHQAVLRGTVARPSPE